MKHRSLRLSLVAIAALCSLAMPACTRRSHAAIPSGTPLPSTPPAQADCVRGLQTNAFRRKAAATPTPMPVSPATLTIDSNPQGLQVEVDGAYVGKTSTTQTPGYSNNLHKITVFNQAGGQDYEVCYAQDANPAKTIYYNRAADTSAKVTSVQSVAATPQTARRIISRKNTARTAPGLIEVQYRTAALHSNPESIEAAAGVRMGRAIGPATSGLLTRVLRVDAASQDRVLAQLRARSDVASAEAAQYRYLKTTTPIPAPNDPHFSITEQWDMYQIQMLNAWAYPAHFGSTSIPVAIIDTGLDTRTENTAVQADLVSKLTFAESVINGVITTGNAAVQDDDGHGTNVAGIAVATANNGVGFVGVAPGVSLQAYRIFSGSTTTTTDEAQAIYDAVAHGAKVINLSLGSCPGDGPDAAEKTAIEFAIGQGVFIAAAAGNERADPTLCPVTSGTPPPVQQLDFPAAYAGVMAVGASAIKSDNGTNASSGVEYVASYSNSGPGLGVVAPGGDPSSTSDNDLLHWISNLYSTTGSPPCSTPSNCYVLIAGTSQATPHVAGAAALLLSANSSLTPPQLIQILEGTADDIKDPNEGHGRLNVYRAMAAVTGDANPPSYVPATQQLIAFAYTNSGAINAAPTIINVTFPGGIYVNADGSFRMADIPTSATSYKIGVWYDANGDGKVDAGDRFGASAACTATAPCSSASAITVTTVTGSSFALP